VFVLQYKLWVRFFVASCGGGWEGAKGLAEFGGEMLSGADGLVLGLLAPRPVVWLGVSVIRYFYFILTK
jgi:hypothetical protein